ncbi:MAG: hypothetical protein Q7K39_03265 [Candidatus Magasanikbacteria bacterium]|nr:hypothetical protein [Candidatus Magasanikbacteria bacterium]
MKKLFAYQLVAVFVAFLALSFVVITPARAEDTSSDIRKQLEAAGGTQGANYGEAVDPRVTAALIIRAMLGMTTIILIILNIYAGITWMTAGGNEEKVDKAKTTIRNSTIGLIIVLSAYSITVFATYIARGQQFGLGGGPNALSRGLGNFFQSRQGPN